MNKTIVEVDSLVKKYGTLNAVDGISFKINEGDVIYITGDSGSGKSVLLDAIHQDLEDQAATLNQQQTPLDQPSIETIGKNYQDAINLLSRVGLNDAILFLRRYNELSEGQRYRYHLAQLISSGKKFWLCDEFLSTLDRITAKIVAYNIQKQARIQSNAKTY